MELFGIGMAELIAILLIMLVVAGPKRMIQWAYIMGQYTAKLRQKWAEIMKTVQHELDEAKVDITLPKDIPTRSSLNRSVNNALTSWTRPIQNVLDEVKTDSSVVQTPLPAEKVKE
jgi:Sec-independent protein translocase protein TatA